MSRGAAAGACERAPCIREANAVEADADGVQASLVREAHSGEIDPRGSGTSFPRTLTQVEGDRALAGADELGELTDDAITADFRVLQRKRGHRYSLDDVLTAAEAWSAARDASHVLDLGCGLGSVLTMLAWKLPTASFVGVEAQAISLELARRNVARNGLRDRVALWHGDLRTLGDARDVGVANAPTIGGPFALVTGTPPYAPVGTATPSPDSQRTHARLEVRGGVEAYLLAAAGRLAPGGRAVLCAGALADQRVLDGARCAGLRPVRRREAIPRAGERALFTVWTLAHEDDPALGARALEVAAPFVARDAAGQRTEAYLELRELFGLPRRSVDGPHATPPTVGEGTRR